MSAAAWGWVLAIVGTVASVAGVVFSGLAWVQARGARAAAEEARDAVSIRDTALELAKFAADARNLLAAVRDGRDQQAAMTATGLIHDFSIMKGRRVTHLPRGSMAQIDAIIKALTVIEGNLQDAGLPDTERISAVKSCQRIHRKICEIAGAAEYHAEEL
jgi:hypothetical protein